MLPDPVKLPSYTLYRSHCHASTHNVLAYLSSTVEIRVIHFDESNNIRSNTVIAIPQEPVKAVAIQQQKDPNGKPYYIIAVAFVSKFMFFDGDGNQMFEGVLKLTENIATFTNGLFAVQPLPECRFLFAKVLGEITFVNVGQKSSEKKNSQKSTSTQYCSLSILEDYFYMGTVDGSIEAFQLENYSLVGEKDSGSNFPILNLLSDNKNKQIFATTCEGEILLMDKNLKSLSTISAHHSHISRIHLGYGDTLFTFGEDGRMHMFQVEGERKLKIVKSEQWKKIPSLLFTVNKKNFLSLYEDSTLIQI